MSSMRSCLIGSIPPLASLVGSLIAGPCLTILGRRKTLMLISIPYSLGFLLIGFASHSSMLYIGRILDGCMIGFSAPSAQIFVSFFSALGWTFSNESNQLQHVFSSFAIFLADWRMRLTSRSWSSRCFHCYFSLVGNLDHLFDWRFRALERFGLDLERFPGFAFRCHVYDAWNAHLASVEEPRRGGQEGVAIPPWIVRRHSLTWSLTWKKS